MIYRSYSKVLHILHVHDTQVVEQKKNTWDFIAAGTYRAFSMHLKMIKQLSTRARVAYDGNVCLKNILLFKYECASVSRSSEKTEKERSAFLSA